MVTFDASVRGLHPLTQRASLWRSNLKPSKREHRSSAPGAPKTPEPLRPDCDPNRGESRHHVPTRCATTKREGSPSPPERRSPSMLARSFRTSKPIGDAPSPGHSNSAANVCAAQAVAPTFDPTWNG